MLPVINYHFFFTLMYILLCFGIFFGVAHFALIVLNVLYPIIEEYIMKYMRNTEKTQNTIKYVLKHRKY